MAISAVPRERTIDDGERFLNARPIQGIEHSLTNLNGVCVRAGLGDQRGTLIGRVWGSRLFCDVEARKLKPFQAHICAIKSTSLGKYRCCLVLRDDINGSKQTRAGFDLNANSVVGKHPRSFVGIEPKAFVSDDGLLVD